jgi:catechol 2,3-dioxygenase-like lactoylglutathione lyase family enzyme
MYLLNITPILNVSSILESIAWFEKLGWRQCWTWGEPPTFASVGSGQCEIFLCLNGQGSRGGPAPRHAGDDDTGGVWMSWWVQTPADVDAACARALEAGLTVTHPPTDEAWGVRECHIRHPDGHTFRVGSGIKNG